jgi:hypothetical protein
MDIKNVRYNLIDAIMQSTDFEKLVTMYDIITGDKVTTKEVEKIETVVEKPVKKIPVAEIKKGVTLEEIKASQEISNLTYEAFSKMVAEEKWEQSIEELLAHN